MCQTRTKLLNSYFRSNYLSEHIQQNLKILISVANPRFANLKPMATPCLCVLFAEKSVCPGPIGFTLESQQPCYFLHARRLLFVGFRFCMTQAHGMTRFSVFIVALFSVLTSMILFVTCMGLGHANSPSFAFARRPDVALSFRFAKHVSSRHRGDPM